MLGANQRPEEPKAMRRRKRQRRNEAMEMRGGRGVQPEPAERTKLAQQEVSAYCYNRGGRR